MSNSSAARDSLSRLSEVTNADLFRSGARIAARPVRFVGFWTAVALPFLYVPLLLSGLDGTESTAFTALVVVHVLSLVVGHNYAN
jgi:hypothetical protein